MNRTHFMHRTIGHTLRAAREAKGLTLLDVAHQTRIPSNRLQQLEEDNFAAFGNMAYAKSFLKHYSRFLEVDASEVADAFPVPPLGGPSDYRYLTETHGPWIERTRRPGRKESLTKSGGSPVPTLVGMFAVFVIAGVLLGNHLVERQKSDGKHAAATPDGSDGKGVEQQTSGVPGTPDAATGQPDKGKGKGVDGLPDAQAKVPEIPLETIVRPAVLPKSIPAPDSPNTPVRRPEIVN